MDKLEVLIHRQSRIHSMVEFCYDGSQAQLGASDIGLPIQFALSYPSLASNLQKRLSGESSSLSDYADEDLWMPLLLVQELMERFPCIMNTANRDYNVSCI